MKFTDKTHLVKFNATYTIASINLHISDIKKTKMVRTVNIYHTNKVVGDLGELRNKWALWKKVRTFSLAPEQADVNISLPICVNANNILVSLSLPITQTLFHPFNGSLMLNSRLSTRNFTKTCQWWLARNCSAHAVPGQSPTNTVFANIATKMHTNAGNAGISFYTFF